MSENLGLWSNSSVRMGDPEYASQRLVWTATVAEHGGEGFTRSRSNRPLTALIRLGWGGPTQPPTTMRRYPRRESLTMRSLLVLRGLLALSVEVAARDSRRLAPAGPIGPRP
jgi:hypothetical protein